MPMTMSLKEFSALSISVGVVLAPCLSWSEHIDHIANKISSRLGMLRRARKVVHARPVSHCTTRGFYHSSTLVAVYEMDVVPQRMTTLISYRDVLRASLNVGKVKRASCISRFHGPA